MKKSIIIAIVIAVIAAVWVASGVIGSPKATDKITENKPGSAPTGTVLDIAEVRVQNLTAQVMNDVIEVTGRTQASRQVKVSSETDGQVASIQVKKGDIVQKGQILGKLGIRDRSARVTEAEQLVNQRQIQFNAAKELTEKGFNSRVRMAEAQAQLESAKAQLKMARVELSNINITAPFDGVVNDQMVEIGDYVSKGTQMFDIVDLNPIEITGFLTEKQMEHVAEGTEAIAELLAREEVKGQITFIAAAANSETRTFAMEMTLPNADYHIKEGLTAKIKIPVQENKAYKISPSILSLADDGTVGVKIVNAESKVEFVPIDLFKDTPEYLWIGGLPDTIQLITVGQEFVVPGQTVKPIQSEGKSLL
ncbi:MAG: efflux RND transporter periplasmic adaptor subunit [Alphaproteobacteria bacterium]|nr:efflux RND transporter periplasmic adaptor subunit [Alphaproteobacteria bacterium]